MNIYCVPGCASGTEGQEELVGSKGETEQRENTDDSWEVGAGQAEEGEPADEVSEAARWRASVSKQTFCGGPDVPLATQLSQTVWTQLLICSDLLWPTRFPAESRGVTFYE